MPQAAPQITISAPRRVTPGALALINAYGMVLLAPILASILFVSTLTLGTVTLLLPLAVVGVVLLFLPFGFGNAHVAGLVRSIRSAPIDTQTGFIVQLTMDPPLRRGWRALVEDADDFGWLQVTDSALEFYGDSIRLSLPFEHIRRLRKVNVGWRDFFVPRTAVAVGGLTNIAEIQFAERSCLLLPNSRAMAKQLYRRLAKSVPRDKPAPAA